jgi:hypothetical protein
LADVKNTITPTLDRLVRAMPEMGKQVLREEAELTITDAKRQTPVDTGALRSSGFADSVNDDGMAAVMQFGNSSVDYALVVHEDLDARHPSGNAKYLENAMLSRQPGMEARLGAKLASQIATVRP